MPDWCPNCGVMLPPGLEECPNCGARLPKSQPSSASGQGAGDSQAVGGREIFWLSAYILGIALVPLLIAIAIGIVCVWAGGR